MAPPGEPNAWKALGELSTIGMTLVIATVIGLAGGYYLDRWLGTSPWLTLIGLLFGIAAGIGFLTALVYVPPLAAIFELAPLNPWHWLLLATFGPLLLLLEEGRKALLRRTESPDPLGTSSP